MTRGTRGLSAVTLLLLTGLAACGGSSAETPFPVPPDEGTLRAARERAEKQRSVILKEGRPGPELDEAPDSDGDDEAEEAPADDTWGNEADPDAPPRLL